MKGFIWFWVMSSMVGEGCEMIMNYQIQYKQKMSMQLSAFKEECTICPVGSKAKIIPLHAWRGPFGSRRLRSQDF